MIPPGRHGASRRSARGATLGQALRAFVAAAGLIAAATAAPAQEGAPRVTVTGGEHGSFTRIVLQSSRPLDWSLQGADQRHVLALQPSDASVDLRRAFDRIGRNRLSAIERREDGLELQLGCDCPIRAFEDRAGLIVLDILDPPPGDQVITIAGAGSPARVPAMAPEDDHLSATRPPAMSSAPTDAGGQALAGMTGMSDALAGRAGQNLAEALRAQTAPSGGPLAAGPQARAAEAIQEDAAALSRQLAHGMAEAVAQGLLSGSGVAQPENRLLPALRLEEPDAQPEQVRIASGLQRGMPDASDPDMTTRAACQQTAALDFLAQPGGTDFAHARGALMQRLEGEFDRQDDAALADLVRLYLRNGFGAEARQLIDTARAPLAGHDVLRGLADLLEDRQSNSRLHLTSLAGCPGPAGLVAALAGGGQRIDGSAADDLAISFANLPAPLKRLFGVPLMERLIDAGALDQARMVMSTLQLAGPAGTALPALPSALLDHARGAALDAAATLAAQPGTADADTLALRLRLMLETGTRPDPALLHEAEAAAGTLRRHPQGIALMDSVIRLRAAEAEFEAGFETLDRLRRWLGPAAEDRRRDAALTDLLWRRAAEEADDRRFLVLFLTRDDHQPDSLTDATRTALGARLVDNGLERMAIPMLSPPVDRAQRLLLAEAHLMANRPAEAIPLLAAPGDQPEEETTEEAHMARQLLARALRGLGATEAAITALAEGGANHAAARLAMTAGDWQAAAALLRAAPATGEAVTAADPAAAQTTRGAAAGAAAGPDTQVRASPDSLSGTDPGAGARQDGATAREEEREPGPTARSGAAAGAGAERQSSAPGAAPSLPDAVDAATGVAANPAALFRLVEALASAPGDAPVSPVPGDAPVSPVPGDAAMPPVPGEAASSLPPDQPSGTQAEAAASASPGTSRPAAGTTGAEPTATPTVPAPLSARPEAAQMRRNAALLDQSEALRAIAEALLADDP